MADAVLTGRRGASGVRRTRRLVRRRVGPPGATRQEVHRFLLTDARGQPISSVRDRKVICNRVLGVLLQ